MLVSALQDVGVEEAPHVNLNVDEVGSEMMLSIEVHSSLHPHAESIQIYDLMSLLTLIKIRVQQSVST